MGGWGQADLKVGLYGERLRQAALKVGLCDGPSALREFLAGRGFLRACGWPP